MSHPGGVKVAIVIAGVDSDSIIEPKHIEGIYLVSGIGDDGLARVFRVNAGASVEPKRIDGTIIIAGLDANNNPRVFHRPDSGELIGSSDGGDGCTLTDQVYSMQGASGSGGVTLTAGGVVHTKGSYAQIVATTPSAAEGFIICLGRASSATDYLVDIATGPAAGEQIVVANLIYNQRGDVTLPGYYFPLSIPSGTRLSARCQCGEAVLGTVEIRVLLVAKSWLQYFDFTSVETYGVDTTDTGGVSIDPGAVANTKGAYSEIVASTTRAMQAIIVTIGNQLNGARLTAHWNVDIATGAAGSEQIIIPDFPVSATAAGDVVICPIITLPVSIPVGTRLSMRAACSITDATDRTIDGIIYGVS